jgi:LysR family transcriptional activator of nhaA
MKSGVAAASLPKLITHQLLDPAFKLFEPIRLICREGKHDHLIAELAVHELDVVLTDLPIGSTVKIRAYNHLLGESDVTVFGLAPLAAKYRGTVFAAHRNTTITASARPVIRGGRHPANDHGGIEDSALLKVFGQRGVGLFAAPL